MDRVLIISTKHDMVSLVRENHPDLSDCVQVDTLPLLPYYKENRLVLFDDALTASEAHG